jgi:hypothetical protein
MRILNLRNSDRRRVAPQGGAINQMNPGNSDRRRVAPQGGVISHLLAQVLIALLLTVRAEAQERSLVTPSNFMSVTTFELSAPIGDTRKYMTGGFGPGLGWEGRWLMSPRTSAGVSLSVAGFSRHTESTINFPSGAATGDQLRQLMPAQLLATGYLYPLDRKGVRWYAGGGIGGGHVDQDFNLGTHQLSSGAWHVVFAPEIGAEVRGGPDHLFVGVFSLRYNAPLAAGDYLGGGSRRFQYLTLRIGIGEE